MPPPRADDRRLLRVRRLLPGVTVARVAAERPLMRAVPEHFGITMQLAGRSEWTSGGASWSSTPGSVSLKVPGDVLIERAREGAVECQVVLFDPARVDEARAALDRPRVPARVRAVDPRDPRVAPLVALHRRLSSDEASGAIEEGIEEGIEGATCAAMHALIDVVFSPRAGEPRRRTRFRAEVARARALLDENVTETIDLEALAAHARLDKYRLCRAFHEEVGLPPHAYVTHRRVSLAQTLLSRGLSQAEVAARVGFYDQSLLHRHFKRILRLTPGAFVRAAQT